MNLTFKNKLIKRLVSLISAITMIAGVFPFSAMGVLWLTAEPVLADTTRYADGLYITYSSGGAYTADSTNKILTITAAGTYKIQHAYWAEEDGGGARTTDNRIVIAADGDVTLTLSNINLTCSDGPPLSVDSGNLTLILEGSNSLTATGEYPAIKKTSSSNKLKITSSSGDGSSDGSLTAQGGTYNAGIGGGEQGYCYYLEIAGGTVNAVSGGYAAGIGGGSMGGAIYITISGGTVNAVGSNYAAAIGGNIEGTAAAITISGGYITLSKNGNYDYIGGSYLGWTGTLTITGGYFGYGSSSDATVYDKSPASDYWVYDNEDEETNSDYPVYVAKKQHFVISETNGGVLTNGTDYTYADDVLTILTGGEYTVEMNGNVGVTASERERIVINSSGDVILTINDIDVTSSTAAALTVESGNAELLIEGSNYLTSTASKYAALKVSNGSTLKISGSGSLTANGGKYGAGIGGGYEESVSGITISGGTVTAAGGQYGAGIGSGFDGSVSDITINGGTVTATGGSGGAGIGGGSGSTVNGITITGGTVSSTAGTNAAAIGGGLDGSGNNIAISGGYISLSKTSTAAAYIGGGSGGTAENTAITGGYFGSGSTDDGTVYDITVYTGYYVYENKDTSTNSTYPVWVSLPNDFVITEANGSLTEGTDYTYTNNVLTILTGGDYIVKMNTGLGITATTTDRIVINSSDDVTLTISNINASSSTNSPLTAESGNVYLILDGDNYISSTASNYAALSKTSADTVLEISGSGGSLIADGGKYAAGIGGSGITITDGTITAAGGRYGAGIGGGFEESVSDIAISGGIVNANGGTGAAAIGSGYSGSVSGITISGGYFTLSKGSGAAYIGEGSDGTAKNISITGGYFANGSVESSTVYDAAPDSNYYTAENTDSATSAAYPYCVRKYRYFEITADEDIYEDEDYTYDNDEVLTIIKSGAYTVTMADGKTSTDTDRIAVNADGDVTLTIKDIVVTSSTESPISADGGNLTLVLDGSNSLTAAGSNYAGLSKKTSVSLKITSIDGDGSTNGSLTAEGGEEAAGIGGDRVNSGSNITIAGGTVTAAGGTYGAGIGGGRYTDTENITISGGTVNASSSYGAGIGSGQASNGSSTASGITISGGTVTAASTYGAGIGGGYSSSGSTAGKDITISGGVVNASSTNGASIGGGSNLSSSTTASSTSSGIKISGGTVTLSSKNGADIGCGISQNGTADKPIIDGGSVKAPSGFIASPVNSDGEKVTLYTVANTTEGHTISVQGKVFVKSVVYHSSNDTNQYLYVAASDEIYEYLLGDVDSDEDVDKIDAALLLKHLSGIKALTDKYLAAADVNTDGNTDMTDVIEILKTVQS